MYLHLSEFGVLFYGLALAFCVVNLLQKPKVLRRKPFTCMKCMSGWGALTLALLSGYGWESVLLLIAGLFVGAIAEGIIMRWL
jgi:hypothetical protein